MTRHILIQLIFAIVLPSVFKQFVDAQVFELTVQNFEQFTKDKDVMLVEFFAPWCHHCQELQPEWEKAASALAVNREYILGKADCFGTGKDLCDRFGVQMYPSIKLFRHGVFQQDFEGDRNADAIIRYLQQVQSQAAATQPDGGWTPNADPWQTGASFQYAYPMTTPPMNPTIQPVRQIEPIATARPFAAPVANQWLPIANRPEPQRPIEPPPPNGNNLWNFFNTLWNRNQAQAPSLFQSAVSSKPALPSVHTVQQQQQPRPEPMQTRTATATIQYQSNNNAPFQAQASAYQLGFQKNPSSSLAMPAAPVAGTYQGLLDSTNNGLGTSFIVIDGKPYAIRRVINRYSNAFTPGSVSIGRFQPFPRFGRVYMRGVAIPHVVRQALVRSTAPKAPARQQFTNPSQQRSFRTPFAPPLSPQVSRIISKAPATHVQQPLPIASNRNRQSIAAQRFHVAKPNYMQMYSKYVKAREMSNLRPNPVYPRNKGRMDLLRGPPVMAMRRQQTKPVARPPSLLSPGRKYAVSIKGSPGSLALEAIRYKAVTNPGFLSGLLSGRSRLAEQRRLMPVASVNGNRVNIRTLGPKLPVNLPQTDRALIREKIIRPANLRGNLAPKSAFTGSPPAKIVYIPQSAYRRLPTWYRPKIGPALVKYTIKTNDQARPPEIARTANKKQALVRPPVVDIWRRIYNFYNKKGTGNLSQRGPLERPALTPVNNLKQGTMLNTRNPPGVAAVGSPIIRVRNFQNPNALGKNRPSAEGLRPHPQMSQRVVPFAAGAKSFLGNDPHKSQGKMVPAQLWDKRSRIRSFFISKKNTIPQRPTSSGNWGTLRKKRSWHRIME